MGDARLKILVANDDGYQSEPLHALVGQLGRFARVITSVPLANNSGKSSSITINSQIVATFVKKLSMRIVHGTPTDCVHLGLLDEGFLPWRPMLTVTGINRGPNLGNDALYSGTIAAAAESVSLGVPAIAFSMGMEDGMAGPVNYAAAAEFAARLVERQAPFMLENPTTLLNVNIPDLPLSQLKPAVVCPLSQSWPGRKIHRLEPDETTCLHRFLIGELGEDVPLRPDRDHALFAAGHVTITPLRFDLTEQSKIDEVGRWLSES